MYKSFVYRASPRPVQNLLISAKAFVYNWTREAGVYRQAMSELADNQWATPDAQKSFQQSKLRMLRAAIDAVPFYQDSIERFGDDLDAYPLIDKTIVNQHSDELLNTRHKGPRISGRTSGTSGQSLQLLKSLDELRWEQAFTHRQISWAGCDQRDRKAWIRGDMIIPAEQNHPPYSRRNHVDNRLLLSSYHLSDESAGFYIRELEEFDPVFIQAYPSSIHFLARSLIQSGRSYRGAALKAIITSSETLTTDMRNDISSAFGVSVYDWYGSYERVAAIGTCEHGTRHLLTDYSHTQLLPADNGLFEIVGTSFHNLLMPLIRYRTGDYVGGIDEAGACQCKRAYPIIIDLHGRADDSIITPDGKSINRLDHIFKLDLGITEAQIIQDTKDTLTVKIVAGQLFHERNMVRLRNEFTDRIGGSMQIEIERVDRIPRTANGKLKSIICNYRPQR